MSNDKKLQELISKRYAEVNKEDSEPAAEATEEMKPVPEKKEQEKTVSYLPHRIGNKYFLIKIEYFLDMESDHVAESGIEILGVVPLAQKIIALQYEQTQAKSLKYYYDSQKNKEIK
jgi:hypothetical protein